MEKIRVVVAAQDRLVRSALSAALQHAEIEPIDALGMSSESVNRILSQSADAVVIFYEGMDSALEMAERLYVSKGVLAIIMVCRELNAALLQRMVDCGAAKAIDYNDNATRTGTGCYKNSTQGEITRLSPFETGSCQSRVLSVFGTKGGSGKTMLAVNIACQLAASKLRVALVDLDLQFGDVGIFLDIARADSIADVVQENALEYKALKSYLHAHSSGVFTLCAPQSPELAETVLGEHVSAIVARFEGQFLILCCWICLRFQRYFHMPAWKHLTKYIFV